MRTMDDSLNETGLKDHPAGSKKLDEAAITDPELLNTMAARLGNLNKMTGRVPGKNPAVSDVEDDDPNLGDGDTGVEDGDTDYDGQAVSDDDDDDPTPEKDEEKEEVGIPDAYVRAAKGNGWSDEDIAEFVKVSPETARKTFENLHNTWNKASREFAAIGRANQQQAQDRNKVDVSAKTDKLEYGGVDIAALKKEFDIDPSVERMLESVNARDQKLTDVLNKLSESRPAEQDASRVDRAARSYDAAAEAAQEQQVNGFFATDPMKPYSKFYGELRFGEMWENLPPNQARNRYAVYTTADQLMAGSVMVGGSSPIELPEALERAHLLVTEGMREEVIRDKIKGTSRKRANSMLFKPSDGKSKDNGKGGKPRTKNELESKVAGFIKKALAK